MAASSSGKHFVRYSLSIQALELLPAGRALKSRRLSPYFFNAGLFCTGKALSELGAAYAARIYASAPRPDVVFGPAYKGIPIVCATACALHYKYGLDMPWAFNRKEEKDHGEGGTLVGAGLKDRRVFALDDVMSTGSTGDETVEIVRHAGGVLTGFSIAFDRMECATEESPLSAAQVFAGRHGIPVVAGANLDDLIEVLTETPSALAQATLPKILQYRERYGAAY